MKSRSRHRLWHGYENRTGNSRRKKCSLSDLQPKVNWACAELAVALLARENRQEKSGISENREIKGPRCREVSPELHICWNPELSTFWPKATSGPRREVGPRKRSLFLEQPTMTLMRKMTRLQLSQKWRLQTRGGEKHGAFSPLFPFFWPSQIWHLHFMTTRISVESWQQSSGFY